MHLRSLLRVVVSALIAVALFVALPRFAQAQTITISGTPPSTLLRYDATGNAVSKRDAAHNPDGISYNDCNSNLTIQFPLIMTGLVANQVVEVWAGDGTLDCTQESVRQTTNQVGCWPASGQNVALSETSSANVRIQDILNKPTTEVTAYTPGTADACPNKAGSFSVYFLMIFGGADVTNATQAFTVQTIGPAAPSGISATPGDTRIEVSWDSESGVEGGTGFTGGAVTSAVQFNIFYQEQGAFTRAFDGGTVTTCVDGGFTDGGHDDAGDAEPGDHIDGGCTTKQDTTSGATCSAPGFDPNDVLPPDSTVASVSVAIPGSSAVIKGLQDGTSYAVAVGALDGYLNVGPVSSLQCVTPIKLNDFFQTYREDGGQAGGGFCSLQAVGLPGDTATFVVASIATCIGFARRRRKPKNAKKAQIPAQNDARRGS